MNPPFILRLFVLAIFTLFSFHPAVYAQNTNYLEDEGSNLWEEQQFLDVTGQEFTTEDTQYVGEEEVKAAEEAARRRGIPTIDLAAQLDRDAEMLPDNVMYGVGTGALIGGWFALVQGGNSRENVRYLTVGTLLGALLGVVVGNKTLLGAPGAPISAIPQQNSEDSKSSQFAIKGINFTPKLSVSSELTKFDIQFQF